MDYLEEQQLNSKLLFIIFFICGISVITGMIFSMREMNGAGSDYLSMAWVVITILVFLALVFYFMFRLKLITEINKVGFHYSYSPIIRKTKILDFNEMVTWKLKTKQGFKEHYKIGYKKNTFAKQTSFMMGGNEYIEIKTKSDHTYIFSTNNYYGLTSAMKKYCSQKEI